MAEAGSSWDVSQDSSNRQFYFYKGRVALYALLRALRVSPSDEIIVPVYTCPAVIEPIQALGCRAVYCDIEWRTFGLCPERFKSSITNRTKAAIVQHTFGVPSLIDELLSVARWAGISVLEDCCHVCASAYRGKRLGFFGAAAFYSHDWEKPLSVGGGGVAIVNSPSLAESASRLYYSEFEAASFHDEREIIARTAGVAARRLARTYARGLIHRLRSHSQAEQICDRLPMHHAELGSEYQKRMPRSLKYRLRQILLNPRQRISARKWTINRYEAGFRSIGIKCYKEPEDCDVILWRYPLLALDKIRLLQEARECDVRLVDWGATPLRCLSLATSKPNHERRFPTAEEVTSQVVTLCLNERQDDAEVDRTLEFLCKMKKSGFI